MKFCEEPSFFYTQLNTLNLHIICLEFLECTKHSTVLLVQATDAAGEVGSNISEEACLAHTPTRQPYSDPVYAVDDWFIAIAIWIVWSLSRSSMIYIYISICQLFSIITCLAVVCFTLVYSNTPSFSHRLLLST